MQVVSVIQIGDVHYPEAKKDTIGDLKDGAISPTFQERISGNKLRQVVRGLVALKKRCSPCGVLICGDLTTHGKLVEYGECIDYLNKAISLSDPQSIQPDHWHVVPGNHDVARKSLQPNQAPFPDLFRPLEAEWNKQVPTGTLTVETLRATRLIQGLSGVELLSLNSCIGCGEWRRIPDRILTVLQKQIVDLLDAEQDNDSKFETIAEQLDAPAFEIKHIDALCDVIKNLDHKLVPVILAHHNLLTQATLRLELYTELLNSGMVRSRLMNLNRPVVYCHGHIHDDPIEILANPEQGSGKVVVVSAREAVEGFNQLRFHYSRDHVPLGMEVIRHRLKMDGEVRAESPIRISFCHPRQLVGEKIQSIVQACRSDWEPLKTIRERVVPAVGQGPNHESVRDRLLEAEWRGFVELEDRDDADPKAIRVRKVTP